MRRYTLLLAVVVLGTLGAIDADAVKPIKERARFDAEFTYPREVCGFALHIQVRGDVRFRTYVDAGGNHRRGMSTGPAKVTFTNLASGRSRTFAIPGPSFFDATGQLTRGTGPWFASDEGGAPVIASGNWVFEDGVPVGSGHVVDVCDALA